MKFKIYKCKKVLIQSNNLPVNVAAFILFLMYVWLAGSSPTITATSFGARFPHSTHCLISSRSSFLMSEAIAFPSIIEAILLDLKLLH